MSCRELRMRNSASLERASALAESGAIGCPSPDVIATAKFSVAAGSLGPLRAKPWRTAFWLDLAFPLAVFGPVLRAALFRLASFCRFEAIRAGLGSRSLRCRKLPPKR